MNLMDLNSQSQNQGSDMMKTDVVKVTIYFSSIAEETIAESPSISVSLGSSFWLSWRRDEPSKPHHLGEWMLSIPSGHKPFEQPRRSVEPVFGNLPGHDAGSHRTHSPAVIRIHRQMLRNRSEVNGESPAQETDAPSQRPSGTSIPTRLGHEVHFKFRQFYA